MARPSRDVRVELIEAAARVVAEEGRAALTTRRLAAEVGTSTMAVYTYFRGMPELLRAVRQEAFDRFAAHLAGVPAGADPVAEIVQLGGAYVRNAVANPALYRFMFMEKPPDEDVGIGISTFERLVDAVRRAMEAARFSPGNPVEAARQCWVISHGSVSLHLVGMLQLDEAVRAMAQSIEHVFVGLGDDPAAARASCRSAEPAVFGGRSDDDGR